MIAFIARSTIFVLVVLAILHLTIFIIVMIDVGMANMQAISRDIEFIVSMTAPSLFVIVSGTYMLWAGWFLDGKK